jgi:acetyltransferase
MTEGRISVDPLGDVDPKRPDIYLRGTLKHGLRVIIRPLHQEDRQTLADAFPHLSERSRYLRFLTGKGELSSQGLRKLVDEVDGHQHVALVMWWARSSRDDILLGDGRFIRLPGDPECADVAVTIADEIHGQGAGTLMMVALRRRAREEGVARFTAVMSPENEASHRMMRSAGEVLRDEYVDGLREIEVDIAGPDPYEA